MEDTARDNRELVRNIVMSKSVEERLLLCAALYEDAKALARVGMPTGLSEEEQAMFVFTKLHGCDPGELVTRNVQIVHNE